MKLHEKQFLQENSEKIPKNSKMYKIILPNPKYAIETVLERIVQFTHLLILELFSFLHNFTILYCLHLPVVAFPHPLHMGNQLHHFHHFVHQLHQVGNFGKSGIGIGLLQLILQVDLLQ